MSTLVWPDARKAVHTLLQGFEHDGQVVEAFYVLPMNFEQNNLPSVNTFVQRTAEGYVDRVVWVVVDVFTSPGEGINLAESMVSFLANRPHDVPDVGFVDDVRVEQTPVDLPRPDGVEQTQFTVSVTCRPV